MTVAETVVRVATNPVQLEQEGKVVRLVLNRPEVLNAVDGDLIAGLHAALSELEESRAVTAVAVTGAGRAFCSGADVTMMEGHPARHTMSGDRLTEARDAARRFMENAFAITRRLVDLPQATIAAVKGPVAGAGISLALACDFRVAADNAVFVTGFTQLSLPGDWGVSCLLREKVGDRAARRLLIAGERIDAGEALRIGLVDEVVPADELNAVAEQRLACLSQRSLTAVRASKALLRPRGLAEALAHEIEVTLACQETQAHADALAAFMEASAARRAR